MPLPPIGARASPRGNISGPFVPWWWCSEGGDAWGAIAPVCAAVAPALVSHADLCVTSCDGSAAGARGMGRRVTRKTTVAATTPVDRRTCRRVERSTEGGGEDPPLAKRRRRRVRRHRSSSSSSSSAPPAASPAGIGISRLRLSDVCDSFDFEDDTPKPRSAVRASVWRGTGLPHVRLTRATSGGSNRRRRQSLSASAAALRRGRFLVTSYARSPHRGPLRGQDLPPAWRLL